MHYNQLLQKNTLVLSNNKYKRIIYVSIDKHGRVYDGTQLKDAAEYTLQVYSACYNMTDAIIKEFTEHTF